MTHNILFIVNNYSYFNNEPPTGPKSLIKLLKICSENKIHLIEDCAHSLGSKYDKKFLGNFNNLSIFSFQAIKHMCAEMAADLEPCYSLVWHAAHCFDNIPDESRLMSCHAKSHVSDVSKVIAKKATEVHGGMGFTDLMGIHYWFKRIGVNRQNLGSPETIREEAAKIQNL